jgi:hypothetical protein
MRATDVFKAYTGGIFNYDAQGKVNHGVTLVGWDDSKNAWRIKNSHGKGWGENGFMWITYGCSKIGYAASWVQAQPGPECEDGPSLIAYGDFPWSDSVRFSANANVASVTFNLPREMYVSFVADASAKIAEGSAPRHFTTGLYSGLVTNTMWTMSLRKGSFQAADQHVPVHSSYATKLPAGMHTVYWKLWLSGYTIQLDSGTLTVLAVPCSMGGQLKLGEAARGEIAKTTASAEVIVATKDPDQPDQQITIDRSPAAV